MQYSRGGNSGNACFVSLCGICARILIFRVLHVIPHVSWCQNFCNFKNPSPTANIITILVKTTISEMYHFFLPTFFAKFGHDQDHPSAHKGQDLGFFLPLLVLWHGGQAPWGLQVMFVESGTLGQG